MGRGIERAVALAHSVLGNIPCARGQGRRARDGPGPFCIGECIVRAAALAHSALENIPRARGQGRRARDGPRPFCMGNA
eukprot:8789584-Pyramimonas_sp.AAC.1